MDPWNSIRAAAADRRSGSVPIALRAAQGLAQLTAERDVLRAARALLRAHPTMAPLWRLLSDVLGARDPGAAAERFAERLTAEAAASADALRWILGRRGAVVLTHSSSSTVVAALDRVRARVGGVICTQSLPGGEGRALARRLERAGYHVEVVPDAAAGAAAQRADLALVGADALSEDGVTNKVGTRLVALAAHDAGIGCYALACSAKMMPARTWARVPLGPADETTPLGHFDAVVTERGPRGAAATRRACARVQIPRRLTALVR